MSLPVIAAGNNLGLIVDLGVGIPADQLLAIYAFMQSLPECQSAECRFGDFAGIPRVTEGSFKLSPRRTASFYLKFEVDGMGYPADIAHPTLMTLNLYGLTPAGLALAHRYLRRVIPRLFALYPFRLAAIGDVTSFYVNAQLVSWPWLKWQSHHLTLVVLPETHPFRQQQAGIKVRNAPLRSYPAQQGLLMASENQDYKAFKAWLNAQAAAEVQRL